MREKARPESDYICKTNETIETPKLFNAAALSVEPESHIQSIRAEPNTASAPTITGKPRD